MGKVTKNKSNWILAALFCGWIVSYIDRTVISLALVDMGNELNLSATQLGFAISAFFLGYALMQIPGGFLADKFGSKRLIISAVIIWSIFTALTGFAWSLVSLIIIRILFGIGEGMYPAASTKAIATYFDPQKRTKAQSTMMSSNMLGGALAPIICAPLLVLLGWRHVFFVISVLGIFIVIWFYFVTKNATHFKKDNASDKLPKGEVKKLLKNITLWKILLIFFFVNIANWGLFSWMPTYLMKEHGVNMSEVGLIAAIPALFATGGMLLSGVLITKFGNRSKVGMIIGTAGLAVMLFLMANATSVALIIFYQTVGMIFISFIISFNFSAPHRLMPQYLVATAFGMINFGGQTAGILSPTIMGSIISATGSYTSAFIFLAISCLVACAISFTLPGAKKSAIQEESRIDPAL